MPADIEIGALVEALNDKCDRDLGNRTVQFATVIDSWQEGTEWYRRWSDGWIEQGGYKPSGSNNVWQIVNFHTPFKNTNYTIILSEAANIKAVTIDSRYFSPSDKTASSFTVLSSSNAGVNVNWYACGY